MPPVYDIINNACFLNAVDVMDDDPLARHASRLILTVSMSPASQQPT